VKDGQFRIYRKIGSNIKYYRELVGKTRQEVSKALGMNDLAMTNIENGHHRTSIHSIYNIASSIGVPVKYLIEDIEDDATIRERALAKLTDEERIVLGLV
jgi:transcriptional regulator with XRE-family HTH domain